MSTPPPAHSRTAPSAGPRWRIYYAARADTEYAGAYAITEGDVPLTALDRRGVQVIVQRDPDVGRVLITGDDYYWWDAVRESWFGGDRFGLFDYLTRPGWKLVLFGRTLTTPEYREIYERAVSDPDFPLKSARACHPRERPPPEPAPGDDGGTSTDGDRDACREVK